jgi:hypothetical protein
VGEAPVTPVYALDSSYLTFPTNRAITLKGGLFKPLDMSAIPGYPRQMPPKYEKVVAPSLPALMPLVLKNT